MLPTTSLSAGLSLRDVLPEARICGARDVRFTACCSDPRSCREGDLFVALLDEHRDGHDFASEAVRRGAAAVLAERRLPVGVPQCLVEDSREAYGDLCQKLAGQPTKRLRLIGVTGASGKTTTSRLLASVLSAAGMKTAVLDTLGRHDGGAKSHLAVPSPSPPVIADWLSAAVANGCQYAVLELSSVELAARLAAGLSFDVAVLTNLRRGAAQVHGNLANYQRATRRLFEQLKSTGFAIYNNDDSGSRDFAAALQCSSLGIGLKSEADISGSLLEQLSSEQTFLMHAGDETTPVRTTLIGEHQVANCLSAAAAALALGIDSPTVARGLESVDRLPGRLERVECGQSFGVFVDSAHTPDRLSACLKTIRKFTRGRLLCVYGARPEAARDERSLLGRAVEQHADYGIVTTARIDEGGSPLQIAHDILDGYYRPAKAHVLPGRAAAIGWAIKKAKPGDAVLIAGNDAGVVLPKAVKSQSDDVAIARHWLYREAAKTAAPRIYSFAGRG